MPLLVAKPLNSKALAHTAKALVVMFCAIAAGCQSIDSNDAANLKTVNPASSKPEVEWTTLSEQTQPQDIWERIREGYKLQEEIGVNPRVEQQRLWFASNPSFVRTASDRSSPYIHYIVEQLEERNMPMELALLPMIESAYNPFAYSHAKAVGLWQFMPATGKHFNLRQTSWYDGRRDVMASTHAAITYLSRLHDMFNGDWLLALAAYNAGEGRVSRAIERNQKLGLPVDYWNLPLPEETRNYVPKLLAISQVVLSPDAYGVALSPVANEPYFEQVVFKQEMDLNRIAELADVDPDELYLLNPAFKRHVTMDGPKRLLVPMDKADQVTATLANLKPQDLLKWQQYTVRRGDNLSSIARRYGVATAELKRTNKLSSNRLRIGQRLTLPMGAGSPLAPQQALASNQRSNTKYTVKRGDSLSSIARANKVSINDVKRWNGMKNNNLRAGQVLALKAQTSTSSRSAVTYYKVRKGDSLSVIAQRFKVPMKHLKTWNPRSSSALKPGQTLTLRLPR
ncbi:MAG: LysM peptidoglycan-binding domain-containing protein [Pseudomonas marincola]|jgi:membrane-bound lytic murein transglycosylase D|uniref:LysM peptidoglycan-binding domain-containing protein n=1 Tax=Pseudomonas marincola TaxID=437900 RepID=UPI0030023DE9